MNDEDRRIIDAVFGPAARRRLDQPTTVTDFYILPHSDGQPFCAHWIVKAPWAHPAWDSYFVMVVDLKTPTPQPAYRARPGVTHELMIFAMNPGEDVPPLVEIAESGRMLSYLLRPANYGYQFTANSDKAATERIQGLVDRIVEKTLSPDTDHRKAWDLIFDDGVSLRRG